MKDIATSKTSLEESKPTEEPLTVHIVKLATHGLPWLVGQGFTPFVPAGLSFHGQLMMNRDNVAGEWEDTLHKEWHSETRNAEKLNCFEILRQSLIDEIKFTNKKMAEVWIASGALTQILPTAMT